jgi:hypothetical protein
LLLSDKCTVLPLPDKNYTISGETLYREARLSIFHLIIPPITDSLVSRLLYRRRPCASTASPIRLAVEALVKGSAA